MTDLPAPLGLPEVVRLLRNGPTLLRAAVAAAPDGMLSWHPAPDGWCIKDVLGHLIEAERHDFAGRLRTILQSVRTPQLPVSDQIALTRARRDCQRAAPELLTEFGRLRRASMVLVVGLRDDELGRCGHHPRVGDLHVADLLHEWVYHDRDHLRQALANVQAYVWSHLGNLQRFYQV